MAVLCPGLIGRESEIRRSGEHMEQMARASLGGQGISADVLTRILARCDGLSFAVEEVLATALSSGELVLDEAGCT